MIAKCIIRANSNFAIQSADIGISQRNQTSFEIQIATRSTSGFVMVRPSPAVRRTVLTVEFLNWLSGKEVERERGRKRVRRREGCQRCKRPQCMVTLCYLF